MNKNIIEIKGKKPILGKNNFVAPSAYIIGDVKTGYNCSFWFGAVVRGDVNSIVIGNNVNVQDNAVLHCTYKKTKLIIGNNVSIGHGAVVHGCTIEENVLIGIGAIILDNAYIEKNVIVAAGAVVKEGERLEANSIYAGVPAKKIKSLDAETSNSYIERIAKNYELYAGWFEKYNILKTVKTLNND